MPQQLLNSGMATVGRFGRPQCLLSFLGGQGVGRRQPSEGSEMTVAVAADRLASIRLIVDRRGAPGDVATCCVVHWTEEETNHSSPPHHFAGRRQRAFPQTARPSELSTPHLQRLPLRC
ncbi:unnamed protein product [Soboliphyme baturini]|uniref:Uncharacterized protein n=1 Tax=Soboliphyme baturini TaxID=241478 RepID=A0A183J1B5_9BILA|nr:unnamed protein product [Soboliphyme baturini]